MKTKIKIHSVLIAMSIFMSGFFMAYHSAYCDMRSDRDNLYNTLQNASDEETPKIQSKLNMYDRLIAVSDSLDSMKKRVDSLGGTDSRKKGVDEAFGSAKKAVDAFTKLSPDTSYDPEIQRSNKEFDKLEKEAINALNSVNQALIAPQRPGNVYSGDLTEDFIPGLIKFAFRFASLGVLVAFIVSGVLFVIAFGEESRVTKAKHILYYTLIGFAFIALAYAIVKAITDVNYFGII